MGGCGLLNREGIPELGCSGYKYLQADQLNSLTRDFREIHRVTKVGKKGSFTFSLPMRSNDVVLLTLEKI